MTVVTVGSGLNVAVIWSFMFILTLVQRRTHVDTVQTVLHITANSRHICWSHTMKVLISHATFVRRNSVSSVAFRDIYFVTKVWSRMFAVTVKWVSAQHTRWNVISRNTRTINSFAVVHVVNISNTNIMLWVTSTDVLLNWDTSMSSRGEIETENNLWTIACWTELLMLTQDLSVRFTPRFRTLLLVVFLTIRRSLSNELLATDSALILFD